MISLTTSAQRLGTSEAWARCNKRSSTSITVPFLAQSTMRWKLRYSTSLAESLIIMASVTASCELTSSDVLAPCLPIKLAQRARKLLMAASVAPKQADETARWNTCVNGMRYSQPGLVARPGQPASLWSLVRWVRCAGTKALVTSMSWLPVARRPSTSKFSMILKSALGSKKVQCSSTPEPSFLGNKPPSKIHSQCCEPLLQLQRPLKL